MELASEGVLRGAVQVPPSGEPVVFLADAPVTGGYPVVAYVHDPAPGTEPGPRGAGAGLARGRGPGASDVDQLAQLRPGQQVRFRATRATLEA